MNRRSSTTATTQHSTPISTRSVAVLFEKLVCVSILPMFSFFFLLIQKLDKSKLFCIVHVQVVRRQSLRRKSTLSSLLFGEDEADALKSKNIKQTELVAALREAIARTADHFHCLDPRHSSTVSSRQRISHFGWTSPIGL